MNLGYSFFICWISHTPSPGGESLKDIWPLPCVPYLCSEGDSPVHRTRWRSVSLIALDGPVCSADFGIFHNLWWPYKHERPLCCINDTVTHHNQSKLYIFIELPNTYHFSCIIWSYKQVRFWIIGYLFTSTKAYPTIITRDEIFTCCF